MKYVIDKFTNVNFHSFENNNNLKHKTMKQIKKVIKELKKIAKAIHTIKR